MTTPDDDFSDLDAAIAAAMEQKAARSRIATQHKRLEMLAKKGTPDAMLEHQILLAAVRKLEEGLVWRTDSAVALFHTQHCTTCGSTHRFFMGWMTGQQHVSDRTARRLVRGRPVERLPQHIEEHDTGAVEMCSDCIEACLIIEGAIENAGRPDQAGGPSARQEPRGEAGEGDGVPG